MIPAEELVLDDLVIFEAGNQIPADAVVEEGEVSVNEALITVRRMKYPKNRGTTCFREALLSPDSARPDWIRWGQTPTFPS